MGTLHDAIVIVADEEDSSASRGVVTSLLRRHEKILLAGWDMMSVDYPSVITNHLPHIDGKVAVVLCFPYAYWNKHIERVAPGIYGNPFYGRLLKDFLAVVDGRLRRRFGEQLSYLNSPASIAFTRQKLKMKERLAVARVPTPVWYEYIAPETLMAMLDRGQRLYAKCPCGSMGKGISVLAKGNSWTNYAVREGRFDFPSTASGNFEEVEQWRFVALDERDPEIIELLCSSGFLFEEAATGVIGDRRIELRITIVGSMVADYQWRSAPIEAPTTRCIDHGEIGLTASCESPGFTLSPNVLSNAFIAALDACRALDLNYCVCDMVFSGEVLRPLVIDVQSFPVLGATERVSELIIYNLTKRSREALTSFC